MGMKYHTGGKSDGKSRAYRTYRKRREFLGKEKGEGGQKKSLGQNFLTSQSALAAIIAVEDIQAKEVVLEVGPGRGALTRELLESGARVVATEKDESLVLFLQKEFADAIKQKHLRLVSGDILKLSLKKLKLGGTPYKIVANIPYYITGKFLRNIFSEEKLPERVVLLLQKEVAERIARDKKESVLSLSIRCYGTPRYVKTVPAGSFSPPPSVDSAILLIENISRDFFSGFSEVFWFRLVKAGFAQKRKKLIRNLESVETRERLQETFRAIGISENSRAEDLSLAVWKKIAGELYSGGT